VTHDDLAAHARAIIDANLYLTPGHGRPGRPPVDLPGLFGPPAGDREFSWVSATDARHSRHLTERPQVSMVIFDSTVAPYYGRAVYAVGRPASCWAATSTALWGPIPGPTVEAPHR
jgi:hypothetical protein